MKFLLDFVPCWGSQELERSEGEELPGADDTSTLVLAKRRISRRRKRNGGGTSAGVWKPSLTAIYEDKATGAATKKAEGGFPAKRRTSGRGMSRSIYHDNYSGKCPLETGIAAFAPTPFMF